MTKRRQLTREELRKLGVPEDLTAEDVMALFSLPDDDDTMHSRDAADGETGMGGKDADRSRD